MSIHSDCITSLDPNEIAKGLRSGLIRLTPADDALRTPLVNAYLRQVEQALVEEYERQAGLSKSASTA